MTLAWFNNATGIDGAIEVEPAPYIALANLVIRHGKVTTQLPSVTRWTATIEGVEVELSQHSDNSSRYVQWGNNLVCLT